uniref:GATA-type domain-containing protein n=1 Tax=Strongyloides stercoralis TaxID=6248 RepID=A0A0K0ENZ5_STRER
MSISSEAFTSYMNSINAPSPKKLENCYFFNDKKITLKLMDSTTSEMNECIEKMTTQKDSLSNCKEKNEWEHVSQEGKETLNTTPRQSTTSKDTYSAKKHIRPNNALNQNWRDNIIIPERDKKLFRYSEKYFPGKCDVMRSEIDDNWRAENKNIVGTNIYPTNLQCLKGSKEISYAKETELTGNERNWNKETLLINGKKTSDNKVNIIQNDDYQNVMRDEKVNADSKSEFDSLNCSFDSVFLQNNNLNMGVFSEPLPNINNNVVLQNNGNAFDTLLQSFNIDNSEQQFKENFSNNLIYSVNDTPIQSHNLFDLFENNLNISNNYLPKIPMQLNGHSDYLPVPLCSHLDTTIMNQSLNGIRKIQNPIMNMQNNVNMNSDLAMNNLFNIPPVNVANNNALQNLSDQILQNFNSNSIINEGKLTDDIIQLIFHKKAFSQLLQCSSWFTQRDNLRWFCINDIGDMKGPFCAQDLTLKFVYFHIPPLFKFHCEQLPFNGWLTLVELIKAAGDRIPFFSSYFPRTKEEYNIVNKYLNKIGEVPKPSKWIHFFQNEEKMKQPSYLFDDHIVKIGVNLCSNPLLPKSTYKLTTEQFIKYANAGFFNQQYQNDKINTGTFNQQSSNFDDINRTETLFHNKSFNPDLDVASVPQDFGGNQLSIQQHSNYCQSGNKITNNVSNNFETQKMDNNDNNHQNNQSQTSKLKESHQKKSIGDNKEREIPTFHCGTWIPQSTKKKSLNKNSNHNNNSGNHQHTDYYGKTNVQKPTLLSSSKNWDSPRIKPDDDIPKGKVPTGLVLGEFLGPATGQTMERPIPQHSVTASNSRSHNHHWNNSTEHRNSNNNQVKQNESTENKLSSTSPTIPVRPVGAVWKNDNKNNGNGNNKGSSSNKSNNCQSTFGAEEAANELQQWLFTKFKGHKSEADVLAFCQFISNVDNPIDIEDYFSTNFGDSLEVRKIYREYIEKRNEIRSRVIKAKSGQDDLSAPAQAIGFMAQPIKKNKKKSG